MLQYHIFFFSSKYQLYLPTEEKKEYLKIDNTEIEYLLKLLFFYKKRKPQSNKTRVFLGILYFLKAGRRSRPIFSSRESVSSAKLKSLMSEPKRFFNL